MSVFPDLGLWMYGGAGFPGGFPGPFLPVTMVESPIVPPEEVKPESPLERSFMPLYYGGQTQFSPFDPFIPAPASTPWLYWTMRKWAAINLAFVITTAPMIAAGRSIEVVDDKGNKTLAEKMKKLAERDVLPVLEQAIEPAAEMLHFGYWLQEIEWTRKEGMTVPLRPLSVLPTEGVLYCDKQRQFAGFQIGTEFRDARYAFLAVNQPHIHPVLGYSRNENAKADWWRAVQSGLEGDKAERKAAGTQMMLGMMNGASFTDDKGNPMMPGQICEEIAIAAGQNKVFKVPLSPFRKADIVNKPELAKIPAVTVDKFDWGNMGTTIEALIARQGMHAVNMMRAWNRAEREAMEGEHGTKAESGVQGNLGTIDTERVGSSIVRQWDIQVLETWRVTNWGEDAPVLRTVQAKLEDDKQEFLQRMNLALATDRNTGPLMQDIIDQRGSLEQTGVPVVEKAEEIQRRNVRLAQQAATAGGQSQQPGNGPPDRGGVDPAVSGNGNGSGEK